MLLYFNISVTIYYEMEENYSAVPSAVGFIACLVVFFCDSQYPELDVLLKGIGLLGVWIGASYLTAKIRKEA
jgi:hypothetical protein